jgi:membrane protease YdiL (CAAX protease family)
MAFLMGAGMILIGAAKGRDQLLERPEAYLARVLGRELDAAERADHMPKWQKVINAWDTDTPGDALKEAIETYQQFERDGLLVDSDGVRRTLAVLLREAGQTNEAQAEIERLPRDEAVDFRAMLKAAYGPSAFAKVRLGFNDALELLAPEWARDKVAWRLAVSRGNTASAALIAAGIQNRGQHVQNHVTFIAVVNLVLILAGLAVALAWFGRGRPGLAEASGRTVGPWTLRAGYAVLVRGAVIGLIVAGCLSTVSEWVPLTDGVATLASALPMFWLTRRHLLKPYGCTWADCLGLRPSLGGIRTRIGVILFVLALMLGGEMVLSLLTSPFEQSSLAESIPEDLLFGSWGQVLAAAVDSIIWAPLVEEFVFRGILYPTLRRRLAPWMAAALSSTIFGIAHGYSWQGFLVIWWSGFLWALAYEKSKSLWPGIICHAVSNTLATISPLLIYRF